MYKNKTFLALVPARGGSKGIPHKNITLVNGKPLIDYTLQAAMNSEYIDKIIVSTDSEEIMKHVPSDITTIKRPTELATDKSKTITAVLHAIKNVEHMYDYLVLLQPTQPLRESWHIDQAIETLVAKGSDNIVSVSPVQEHPILLRKINEEHMLSPLLSGNSSVRRQDFEEYYVINGAIYINKVNDLTMETSFNDNDFAYIMESKYHLDIDEPADLLILQEILERGDCR